MRQLNKAASSSGQMQITDYFSILNEMEILIKTNEALRETLQNMQHSSSVNSKFGNDLLSNTDSTLKMLLQGAIKNSSNEQTIKMFAAYIRMLGGRLLYETLHANLPLSLPSPSTISLYIADKGPNISEGFLRTDELLQYLKDRNLPLAVCVSEDVTRTVGKIVYDQSSNKLVGFSLPLNDRGMPETDSFFARSAFEIEQHFLDEDNSISTMAYTIMAQPLAENIPPFTLTLYATDNKFKADSVISRWRFITKELAEKGIRAYCYASDGDSRLLRSMKILSGIGIPDVLSDNDGDDERIFYSPWFSSKPINTSDHLLHPVFFQDTTHIATKLRNRLLRESSILPLGRGIVSKTHLKYLIDKVSKDKHFLTSTDVEPTDRQNFLSAQKICDQRTQDCLKKYVPGSESTVIYLKVMNAVISSMLDPKMAVNDRISNLWYAVFVLRIWRSWLLQYPKLKPKKKSKEESWLES